MQQNMQAQGVQQMTGVPQNWQNMDFQSGMVAPHVVTSPHSGTQNVAPRPSRTPTNSPGAGNRGDSMTFRAHLDETGH